LKLELVKLPGIVTEMTSVKEYGIPLGSVPLLVHSQDFYSAGELLEVVHVVPPVVRRTHVRESNLTKADRLEVFK